MTLGLLSPGERCEIVKIRQCNGCEDAYQSNHSNNSHSNKQHTSTVIRAEEMGLRAGKQVEILKNDGNLLLLLVDEARIAIDRRMAMKIMVRR